MSWLLLTAAIVAEVGGTMLLRLSEGLRRRRWAAPVALCYLLAFTMLSLALRHGMSVGVAYGVWAASGVAATALLARLFFREPLTPVMALGILLIGAGVLLVEQGSAR
ncbi:MAG: multidrug efflux SMR transporter [Pseudoclavibacter sp.]|nr:multidrug efflux SMR transporter [Pseudoclavibacter sp.]